MFLQNLNNEMFIFSSVPTQFIIVYNIQNLHKCRIVDIAYNYVKIFFNVIRHALILIKYRKQKKTTMNKKNKLGDPFNQRSNRRTFR